MKAVSLSGLSTESSVYAVRAQAKESPAAFKPYGAGYVGYLGDVNAEVESTAVILGMCGCWSNLGYAKLISLRFC